MDGGIHGWEEKNKNGMKLAVSGGRRREREEGNVGEKNGGKGEGMTTVLRGGVERGRRKRKIKLVTGVGGKVRK